MAAFPTFPAGATFTERRPITMRPQYITSPAPPPDEFMVEHAVHANRALG
jgi:hypothetical protein